MAVDGRLAIAGLTTTNKPLSLLRLSPYIGAALTLYQDITV